MGALVGRTRTHGLGGVRCEHPYWATERVSTWDSEGEDLYAVICHKCRGVVRWYEDDGWLEIHKGPPKAIRPDRCNDFEQATKLAQYSGLPMYVPPPPEKPTHLRGPDDFPLTWVRFKPWVRSLSTWKPPVG